MSTPRRKQPLPSSNGTPAQQLPSSSPSADPPTPAPAVKLKPAAAAALRSGNIIARYVYPDETGKILYRVNRTQGKKFFQEHLDAKGEWVKGLGDVRRVLYRLEGLCSKPDEPVVVVEGEKDADTMVGLGFTATTSPMGAGKWRPEYSESLRGRDVYLIPDKDKLGRTHMASVRAALQGIAKRAVIVTYDHFPGKDVSDAVAGGVCKADFLAMMAKAEAEARDDPSPAETPPPLADGRESRSAAWDYLSKIEKLPQKWLWDDRIPRGALTLLYGAPGVGKSFLSLDLAARVTTGRGFPDGRPSGPPGDVILITGEDRIETTVKSRCKSAGADEDRIAVLKGTYIVEKDGTRTLDPFALQDVRPLVEVIEKLKNPTLIVIDPTSVFQGEIDDHKNQQVRRMYRGMVQLVEERDMACVIITHPNKGSGQALNRIAGSIALGALVRAAWCVVRDDEDPSGKNRLFLCAKPNLCEEPTGLSYKILRNDESGAAATVSWGEHPVLRTANEAMMDDAADATEAREERKRLKRETENDGTVLTAIDKLPKNEESFVAVKDIEEITGMYHSLLAQVLARLEENGFVEIKWNAVEIPRGGMKEKGRRVVRRVDPTAKVF